MSGLSGEVSGEAIFKRASPCESRGCPTSMASGAHELHALCEPEAHVAHLRAVSEVSVQPCLHGSRWGRS